jgi:hemerythrin-like domain-containing protein
MNDLFPEPAPDFSNPLGLLRACHQRILNHCETLEKLAGHIRDNGIDSDAKKAATHVHRYFSSAGVLHHRDEEEDLFPKLIRQSMKMADLVHQLKQGHQKIDSIWKELAALLANPETITDIDHFESLVQKFTALNREHIIIEEEDFLSVAVHILSTEDLNKISRSMEKRRKPREASMEY